MNELFQDWLMRFALGGGCVCVSLLIAIAARRRFREAQRMMRRLPPWQRASMACLLAVCLAYGGTKTNQVDQAGGTNEVEMAGGGGQSNLSTAFLCATEQESNILCPPPPATSTSSSPSPSPSASAAPTVTPEEIARGWQVWEVRTNAAVDYVMPEGAVLASNWWMRGAYEDVVRIGNGDRGTGIGEWLFPFGTNEYSSLWAFSWGKVRFALASTNAEIVAVGAPMSAVPYRSRLWSAGGADGSRLVTWENFALNRDTNTPVNAQIELRPSGDFVTRSNEVETVCRHVDDFDWDGDGIPNWDDGDPCRHDGDHTGQADGWAEYVDETVGTGMENGYYKLTATFPQAGFRRTLLTVGWHEVVVAEPGEYVFLLEKGNEYGIGLEPFIDGVMFEAVDDMPEGRGPMMPLMLGRGHWEGKWSRDEGRLYLDPPETGTAGCVMWTPKLCVSPGEWNPSAGDRSETFTALLHDRTNWTEEPTYLWTSANSSVTFGSPLAATTRATWQMGQLETVSAHLTVSFGERRLESAYGYTYHDADDGDPVNGASFWVEDVPDTLFVNNDNDLGGDGPDCGHPQIWDDDIPCGYIRLSSTVPTNGTIRIDNLSGFSGDVYTIGSDGRWELLFAGKTWTVHAASERRYPLYFNACSKSRGFDTSQVKVRWIPEVGQERTCVKRFTVVEPVAEPICMETKRIALNGETHDRVYNPCGVVVGQDAYFKIGVEPTAYPDSMIAWEASGGGVVQFVGGNNGREVRVRGVSPGDTTLSVRLGNCDSPPPSFTVKVVTNRTVRLSAWIICNAEGKRSHTEDAVRQMVKTANDIYAQVGVTFDLGDRIVVTNIPAAYDINWDGNADGRWSFQQLTDMNSTPDSVCCYFVNGIFKIRSDKSVRTIGRHNASGLVVSANGTAVTLAHELGHRFGMSDVYWQTEDDVELLGYTCWSRCMEDWNGGCVGSGSAGARYYPTGTLQKNIVRRMLMDGLKEDASLGVDITHGYVFGLDGHGQESDCATGYFGR